VWDVDIDVPMLVYYVQWLAVTVPRVVCLMMTVTLHDCVLVYNAFDILLSEMT